MKRHQHLTSRLCILGGLALGLAASATAHADGQIRTDLSGRTGTAGLRYNANPATGELVEHAGVCQGSRFHCLARVVTHQGHLEPHAQVTGTVAADIEAAYGISKTMGTGKTIAIVDAYGYDTLEADLGVYRTQMGLPACTTANGCLKIVNQTGGATLPPNPPASDDWTIETALDVDMASAACPKCKIVVVQTTTDQDDGLFIANNTAATLGATVISNSWGGAEQGGESAYESYFNHPGIAIFVAAGDDGYNDNGQGPDYPGTSGYTVSVGATALTKSTSTRGWTERVWGGTGSTYSSADITSTGAGGSACSLSIPKPSYQPTNSGCQFKATADVSALGDPSTGPAIYDSHSGGWQQVGGTSASSPMVAAMVAGSGNGAITGKFFYDNAAKFNDVTSGVNGSCGTILCKAGAGWDGPTGVGTPNVALIMNTGGGTSGGPTVAIKSPADGASVGEGFAVVATVGSTATSADLYVDGTMITELDGAPYSFTAPSDLDLGAHTIEVMASDAAGNTTTTQIDITVTAGGSTGPDGNGDGTGSSGTNGVASNDIQGGCAATGGGAAGGGLGVLVALGAITTRRRRARR